MIRPQIPTSQRLNPFSHRQNSRDLIEQFEMFIWIISSKIEQYTRLTVLGEIVT